MISFVLDASAVLALLNEEAGGEIILPLLPVSVMCSVNFSEVIAKLLEKGVAEQAASTIMAVTGISNIIDFDSSLAWEAARLRPLTRHAGLSLGDRACLALARSRGFVAVTADRSWETLNLCEVRNIR